MTIDGGNINASGAAGGGAAGIGGGGGLGSDSGGGAGGSVTINGGSVTATGSPGRNAGGAGIGGGGGGPHAAGGAGGTVNITGGTVVASAKGSNTGSGAGIGGGGGPATQGAGATVTISGGAVTATGGNSSSFGNSGDGAGVGSGGTHTGIGDIGTGGSGTVVLSGGTLDASSADGADGIGLGGGDGGPRQTMTVSGNATLYGEVDVPMTIDSGQTLTVPATQTLALDDNSGDSVSNGTIDLGGELAGSGTLNNAGTIAVSGDSWGVGPYGPADDSSSTLSVTGNAYEFNFDLAGSPSTVPPDLYVFAPTISAPTISASGQALPAGLTPPTGYAALLGWFDSDANQVTASTGLSGYNQIGSGSNSLTAEWALPIDPDTLSLSSAQTPTVGNHGSLSAAGASKGAVSDYESTTPLVCSVSGAVVSYLSAGTCDVGATQAADLSDDYSAGSPSTSFTIVRGGAPTITVSFKSRSRRSQNGGWWTAPVTIIFTCNAAANTTVKCPAPVRVTSNGVLAAHPVSVTASNGLTGRDVVPPVDIDRTHPTLKITGVRAGGSYVAGALRIGCSAHDRISGIASCRLRRQLRGGVETVSATAVSNAGLSTRRSVRFKLSKIALLGAAQYGHLILVRAGHHYQLVVVSAGRPKYLFAAPEGTSYSGGSRRFSLARRLGSKSVWTIKLAITRKMLSHRYWNIGYEVAGTVHTLKLRVDS